MNLFFVSRETHALNLEMLLDLFCCTKYLFLGNKYNSLVSPIIFIPSEEALIQIAECVFPFQRSSSEIL